MKLEGSKILLTGASSGIGAALAPILAERGATVGIVARRARTVSRKCSSCCKKHSPESRMWAVDLSDLDAAEKLALDAWDAFGGLDAVVHNAAIPKRVHMSRLTIADVDETMNVNFDSPVRMTLAVLPKMLERKSGTIVWVSSMGGRIPIANESAYNAAKYAMCGFAEAMYLDLARQRSRREARDARSDRHRDLGHPRQRARAHGHREGSRRPTARPASPTRSPTTASSTTCRPIYPGGIGAKDLALGQGPGLRQLPRRHGRHGPRPPQPLTATYSRVGGRTRG